MSFWDESLLEGERLLQVEGLLIRRKRYFEGVLGCRGAGEIFLRGLLSLREKPDEGGGDLSRGGLLFGGC